MHWLEGQSICSLQSLYVEKVGDYLGSPSEKEGSSLGFPQHKHARMSPHYKPIVLTYCSGSDWVEKAFEVY